MGCDLLALDLVRRWEFLSGPPPSKAKQDHPATELEENGIDYSKMLRRRSSLVVADLPVRPADMVKQVTDTDTSQEKPAAKPKPPPTMFHEPDANSLLDSFGF